MNNFKTGLREKTEDKRDIMLGALFTLPDVKTLPATFKLDIPSDWILMQAEDNCAGHASSLASSYQEGVRIDPCFTWVVARTMKGLTADAWGIELRDMMLGHAKVGGIRYQDRPYDNFTQEWRDITAWKVDELLKLSVYHKKASFTSVEPVNNLDMFDTLRATLFKTQTPIVIGMRWPYGNDPVISAWKDGGYGHALTLIGWAMKWNGVTYEEMAVLANSWDTTNGDMGIYYVSREVINHEVPKFGAMVFVDETPEKLREYIAKGIKLDDSSLKNIIKRFLDKIVSLIALMTKLNKENAEPAEPTKLYLWAQAIKEHEGWFVGSRSYRNNNPGNFKYSSVGYLEKYGNVKKDSGGFAVFPTYDQGWMYLTESLRIWATKGNSRYKPEMTITQFFKVYAPYSDGNDPVQYASVVAKKIGVSTFTQIKDLVV